MAFNVVYSDKDRIQGAIESGVIPRESLVLTSDDAKRSEMYYYDDNGQLKTITKKTQFNSMVGARTWANKYDYIGEVISINIDGQNLLVFDYVHNATDLSVSSGGLTYTTGDSGDSMICYVATYQFAFGATDTSADSVQIPTTTKVQDMIDASVGDINTNTYTIQVSNTAPATGTSDKIITYVVEEAATGSKNSLVEQ